MFPWSTSRLCGLPSISITPNFLHKGAPSPRRNLLPINNMAPQMGSRSNLDDSEKKDIVPTGERYTNTLEIDLVHYHEQCAGRLVLDPKCVSFSSYWYFSLITHPPERQESNLVTRSPHASSFHQMENLSCGRSHPMTRRTLKTSVHS